MKRKIFRPGSFQKFPLALVAGLAFGLSVAPAPASQVVAYGYNMGVAPVLTNAVAVGVVSYSLVALRADGTVAQWGNSASDPGVSNLAAIASGWAPGLGLRADGSVTGWGDDYYGALTGIPSDLTNAVALAVGFYTGIAVRDDGTVAAWGDNDYQLLDLPEALTNVVAVAAGNDGSTALALRADGTVVEWNYSVTNTHPELSNVVAVATANAFMNAAIHFDGSVTVWPTSYYPAPDNLTNIVAVAGAGSHMLALRNNGTVIPWGCDCRSDFVSTTNLTNVTAIAAGGGDGYDYSIFLINYTNPPPVLAAGTSNGIPHLRITGQRFRHYVLEESTDLSSPANWSFKQNLVLPASAEFAMDLSPATSGAARFYRARLMP
jgi:hypothetical protein